ncbi:hypothetical protein IB268_24840 [Achromobacter sp. ACM01]|uniref:hypothetical protein n=1 Tax=Achromobacter sp. ACM01 TaxID=2769298 RepID=UPI001784818E|nr:hypothetical protein [Achromobacter sp. ACM01]MBD9476164.1 hypothetical protein [Achromobacter sp. ACM01]
MKRLSSTDLRLLNQMRLRRAKHALRRTNRFRRKFQRFQSSRIALAHHFGQKSKILTLLEARASKKINVEQGIRVTVPKVFSILDAPEVVVDTINKFAAVKASGKRPTSIYIDQTAMETYDLAASALLDLAAVELKKELQLNNRPGRFEGAFQKYGPVARFIKAIGIVRHLGIRGHMPTWTEMQKLRVFDRRNRHYHPPKSAKTATRKELAAGGFVSHLNDCLATQEKKLTPTGASRLVGCLGELLDNAEEHARFSDWSLLGYLDLDCEQPKVEIAIINFGRSFAETFQELEADHFSWDSVRPYVDRHSSKSKLLGGCRDEDLLTVMALQPHISSKNHDASHSRGHGTVQLLRFFSKVHQACTGSALGAQMALVTGSTFIRFDGKHLLSESPEQEATIAFNDRNSLTDQPDNDYVRSLGKCHFPGTIISIRFPLTTAMVQEEETRNE